MTYNVGSDNGGWKGDKVSYGGIHSWVRNNKLKPLLCVYCNQPKKLLLANISGEYKRELDGWVWCCHKCHKQKHKTGEHKQPTKYAEEVNREIRLSRERYGKRISDYNKNYLKQWKLDNPDYEKNYRATNREKLNKQKREYLKANPEKQIVWVKNNYIRNKKEIILRQTNYAKVRCIIREKYLKEFKNIVKDLIGLKEVSGKQYRKNYFKAEKILKNRHREEYLALLKSYSYPKG